MSKQLEKEIQPEKVNFLQVYGKISCMQSHPKFQRLQLGTKSTTFTQENLTCHALMLPKEKYTKKRDNPPSLPSILPS